MKIRIFFVISLRKVYFSIVQTFFVHLIVVNMKAAKFYLSFGSDPIEINLFQATKTKNTTEDKQKRCFYT